MKKINVNIIQNNFTYDQPNLLWHINFILLRKNSFCGLLSAQNCYSIHQSKHQGTKNILYSTNLGKAFYHNEYMCFMLTVLVVERRRMQAHHQQRNSKKSQQLRLVNL